MLLELLLSYSICQPRLMVERTGCGCRQLGNHLRHEGGQGKAQAFRVRWTTYGPPGVECFQVAVQENFGTHQAAGLDGHQLDFSFQSRGHQLKTPPSLRSFEPACPRGSSCPGLHLELPRSHHQSHPTLSEVLSVYWYCKGSVCLRTEDLRTVQLQLSGLGAGRIQGPNP